MRYVRVVSYAEFTPEGKLSTLSGIVQDITDRKKFELDLLEKIKELERMNALMVNRELKMIELKSEIVKLKDDLGGK